MALTWKIVRQRSFRSGSKPATTREIKSHGQSDPTVILAALQADAINGFPATLDGIPIDQVDQRMDPADDLVWMNVATYQVRDAPAQPKTNEERVSFKITGRPTGKITYSKETTFAQGVGPATPPAPDFKRGINWDADANQFQGTDIPPPRMVYSVTKYVPVGTVTNAWIQSRIKQAYTTNNAGFRGGAIGETLFVGLAGQLRNEDDYQLTYDFHVRNRRIDENVGGITVPSIEGWEQEWILWEPYENLNRVARQPVAVYVERLFDSSDFSQLGITV